jgi:uncharacterized protein YecE (DUF72 family)
VPRRWASLAPTDLKGLERYARVLNAVEINSSFYRPHASAAYERWALRVADDFRFSVKMPKSISHEKRLHGVRDELDRFLDESSGLGEKRGALLLQLPASFEFKRGLVARFLAMLRRRHNGVVVCEPRNATWYSRDAEQLFEDHHVALVAADPPRGTRACEPRAWRRVVYFRLHGSPRCYFSPYQQPFLAAIAERIQEADIPAWCIFDNTGSGAAFENAVRLRDLTGGNPLWNSRNSVENGQETTGA